MKDIQLDAQTRDERAEAVRQAIHSTEMEGGSVDDATRAIFEQYVDGGIDGEEMLRDVAALVGAPYTGLTPPARR